MKTAAIIAAILTMSSGVPVLAHADPSSGGVNYPDQEWKSFNQLIADRYHKVREFIGRKQSCVVAMDDLPKTFFNLPPSLLAQSLPNTVVCIQDIVIGKDTINEASGCSLVNLNVDTGAYEPYFNSSFPRASSTKPCDKGGFDDLMAQKGWWQAEAPRQATVEQALFTYRAPRSFVLIYASGDKFKNWFVEARKRGEAFVAKEREPELKKQAEEKKRQADQEAQDKKAQANEDAAKKKRETLWK